MAAPVVTCPRCGRDEYGHAAGGAVRVTEGGAMGSDWSVIGDGEMDEILCALARGRGDRGFTQAEAADLLDWCAKARADAAMVGLMATGKVDADWHGGGELTLRPRSLHTPALVQEGPAWRKP